MVHSNTYLAKWKKIAKTRLFFIFLSFYLFVNSSEKFDQYFEQKYFLFYQDKNTTIYMPRDYEDRVERVDRNIEGSWESRMKFTDVDLPEVKYRRDSTGLKESIKNLEKIREDYLKRISEE